MQIDLKIFKMDGFDYASVSCYANRPSENTRYLIKRQLPKLIDIVTVP